MHGVRLVVDGIPASIPDRQGQAATFNLDASERVEVLRGQFSAIYRKHAGGTVQLFTRDGKGRPSVEATIMGGSDGTRRAGLGAQGEGKGVGYLLDSSRFETDSSIAPTALPGASSKLTTVRHHQCARASPTVNGRMAPLAVHAAEQLGRPQSRGVCHRGRRQQALLRSGARAQLADRGQRAIPVLKGARGLAARLSFRSGSASRQRLCAGRNETVQRRIDRALVRLEL